MYHSLLSFFLSFGYVEHYIYAYKGKYMITMDLSTLHSINIRTYIIKIINYHKLT